MRRFQNSYDPFRAGGLEKLRRVSVWPMLVAAGFALSLLPGCGSGGDLTPPTYSPDEAARQALAEYDTNHDGYLDAKELERCPALKNRLDFVDRNGDRRLSAEEIAGRIQVYADSQVALKGISCSVQLDGRPLKGATVTYVPEKFLASSLKPASGVSDERGAVILQVQGEKYAGVQPGLYRVQISKKNANGQETIPARYNEETVLGAEVYPRKIRNAEGRGEEGGDFRLTSKSR